MIRRVGHYVGIKEGDGNENTREKEEKNTYELDRVMDHDIKEAKRRDTRGRECANDHTAWRRTSISSHIDPT